MNDSHSKQLKQNTLEAFTQNAPKNIFHEDWDFARSDTRYLTHGLHPYPARMIPQIARRLLNRYSKEHDLVLDPFCGSGTILVECKLLGRNAIGNDINPLARLLAKAKSTPIMPNVIDEFLPSFLQKVNRHIQDVRVGKTTASEYHFLNIEHWFKDYVITELSTIRSLLDQISPTEVKDLAKVAFSLTVLKVSNIYNVGDTFIKRLSKRELAKHKPDVLTTFRDNLLKAAKIAKAFFRACARIEIKSSVEITCEDTRELSLPADSIDLIVTSPPYGEERNTISYTRWTKLPMYWLGYSSRDIRTYEKLSLGYGNDSTEIESETLKPIFEKVKSKDPALARTAIAFFHDYKESLEQLERVLKPGARCCIVIGNRSLKRIRIPMNKVTVDFARIFGLEHVTTHLRRIPTKAIPWTVAKGKTISNESVIVLRK